MDILIFFLMLVVLTVIFKKIIIALFGGIRLVESHKKMEQNCNVYGYPLEDDDTYCPVCMEDKVK